MGFMEPVSEVGCLTGELKDGSGFTLPLSLLTKLQRTLATKHGREALQPEAIRCYLEDEPNMASLEIHPEKLCARLSAPGYMDCTDWQGPFDSEEEALAELAETFDLCPTCGGDADEFGCCLEGCEDSEEDDQDEPETGSDSPSDEPEE